MVGHLADDLDDNPAVGRFLSINRVDEDSTVFESDRRYFFMNFLKRLVRKHSAFSTQDSSPVGRGKTSHPLLQFREQKSRSCYKSSGADAVPCLQKYSIAARTANRLQRG